LDPAPTGDFASIIALLQSRFQDVVVLEESATPQRTILRVSARWGRYRVWVTEIVSIAREYRYYVLDGDLVVVGFDNAADPRAVDLKYGKQAKQHYGEGIPHVHRNDKTVLELTEAMSCADLIAWLEANLEKDEPPQKLTF
jgi:hypothetical protein